MSEYVQPNIAGILQIVNQQTGISLHEIKDDTQFGDQRDRIMDICEKRFGKTVIANDVGGLKAVLGVR